MPQIDFIVLTLTRGWAAKGRYQAVLRHLGLTRRGKTVQVPNTFEFRAAAKKVSHLITVETQEQYKARIASQAAKYKVLPPLRVTHVMKDSP